MNNPYFKFIVKKKDLDIDLTARELLDRIAMACAAGHPMTVSRVMSIKSVASPATLHRKLEDLLEADLVYHKQTMKNRRTKYVMLTTKAERHFKELGECMRKSVESVE